jgi:tRNA 5-methylaminomethyl-2-thiouridine biosynthesis bifunctional protein
LSDFSWTEEGTLYSETYGDIYYHDGGGLEETEYVFVDGNNIRQRLDCQRLVIGELGFGTGLNFLTTWKVWREHTGPKGRLIFITCEKHPLGQSFLKQAHKAFPEITEFSRLLCEKLPTLSRGVHFLEFEEGQVSLLLMYGDVEEVYSKYEGKIDAWYLDGFAPSKNPQMWAPEVMNQLAYHSHSETTLATYTAAGHVRRALADVGFEVKRVKGFGPKFHMTVGSYKAYVKPFACTPPWFTTPVAPSELKTVAIIGSGLAGANMAYYLSRAGMEVTVIERGEEVATGASGNRWGMMFPLISRKIDRLGTFTKAGAAFFRNQLKDLKFDYRQGLLEFLTSDTKGSRLHEALERFPKDYINLLSKQEVSERFGIAAPSDALYHEEAVTLSPKDYVKALFKATDCELMFKGEVNSFSQMENGWQLNTSLESLNTRNFDLLIVATAGGSDDFEQLETLPLRNTRGQVAYLDKENLNSLPNIGLNFVNYLVETYDDDYVLGATFQPDDTDEKIRESDTESLLQSLEENFPGVLKSGVSADDLRGRVCFRAMTKDYFPIVGPVAEIESYKTIFAGLKYGRPLSQYDAPVYHSGLYVLCGLGARGLSLAALSAAYLTRLICDEVSLLPVDHIAAIHPARFIVKELKKS